MDEILLLIGFFLGLYTYWMSWTHPKKFPPGPRKPLPLVGDAYILGADMDKGFQALQEKFGNVVGFWLGLQRAILVSDFDLMQVMLNKLEFSDRMDWSAGVILRRGWSIDSFPGVLFANGNTWTSMRRNSLHIFRDFGIGKTAIEDIIEEEVDNLLHHIDENFLNKPIDVQNFFNVSIFGSLWRIISGERLKIGDPKLEHLVQVNTKMVQEAGKPLTIVSLDMPKLHRFLNKVGFCHTMDYNYQILDYIEEICNNQKHLDEDHPLSFIEAMMVKIKNEKDPNSPFFGDIGRTNLTSVVLDMFIAGSETSSTVLNWAMLLMILNPDVQAKVRQELVNNVGFDKKAKMAEKSTTPYTEAVLLEILR